MGAHCPTTVLARPAHNDGTIMNVSIMSVTKDGPCPGS